MDKKYITINNEVLTTVRHINYIAQFLCSLCAMYKKHMDKMNISENKEKAQTLDTKGFDPCLNDNM